MRRPPRGYTIAISASELTATEITVRWDNKDKSEGSQQYYAAPFSYVQGLYPLVRKFEIRVNHSIETDDEKSLLFIQKSMLGEFKDKCSCSGDQYTVIVDDFLQFGENVNHDRRWLVFHDKVQYMRQWQLAESIMKEKGADIVNYAGGIFPSHIRPDSLRYALRDVCRTV